MYTISPLNTDINGTLWMTS